MEGVARSDDDAIFLLSEGDDNMMVVRTEEGEGTKEHGNSEGEQNGADDTESKQTLSKDQEIDEQEGKNEDQSKDDKRESKNAHNFGQNGEEFIEGKGQEEREAEQSHKGFTENESTEIEMETSGRIEDKSRDYTDTRDTENINEEEIASAEDSRDGSEQKTPEEDNNNNTPDGPAPKKKKRHALGRELGALLGPTDFLVLFFCNYMIALTLTFSLPFQLGSKSVGRRKTFTSVIAGLTKMDELKKQRDEELRLERLEWEKQNKNRLPDPDLVRKYFF